MVVVILRHMKPGPVVMEVREEEERAFSTMKKAKEWLMDNYFYYGHRPWFEYPEGAAEWCHSNEVSWNYIDVIIKSYQVDDDSESLFRYFHAPMDENGIDWRVPDE